MPSAQPHGSESPRLARGVRAQDKNECLPHRHPPVFRGSVSFTHRAGRGWEHCCYRWARLGSNPPLSFSGHGTLGKAVKLRRPQCPQL